MNRKFKWYKHKKVKLKKWKGKEEDGMSRSLNLNKLKNRDFISLSSKEALKEVVPIDWSEEVLTGKKKVIVYSPKNK
ncbi:hypothetical protein [Clostridium autoethanogenum]|uniref:Uncharacterized protein n=2 Tax=Clostridium autoethanogenum TaxID=84023 RepID=A0ABM5NZ61_9CLOT|nr:hypothetical protein [Clostridium autoethanogenum]AGY78002.1 hypothetical protein CAETHG_3801 [Clostridium autoethanogenum DSM 10061]ALU38136.1 Hypothetical protein CLAU_3709 [Clostridium autoethanogenum DSM 10061]OVY50900.1 hypothetical protein WX72_02061 [Clostridium autoethanogenum]DAD54280.1 TPA_exp: protein of unknown function KV_110 [Clostridium autoethanogenum DSM 10061]